MVASNCTKTGSLSSDRCKIGPSVRETCSKLICGFFFPKPGCLRGQEVHADSRTKPMTYQALIGSDFKRAEATFLLGPLEPLFHVPARERHAKHFLDRRVFRSVRDEVWHGHFEMSGSSWFFRDVSRATRGQNKMPTAYLISPVLGFRATISQYCRSVGHDRPRASFVTKWTRASFTSHTHSSRVVSLMWMRLQPWL